MAGVLLATLAAAGPGAGGEATPNAATRLRRLAAEGRIAYHLTRPEELDALMGAPSAVTQRKDGGMLVLNARYGGASAVFGRYRDRPGPFTLMAVKVGEEIVDIGRGRRLRLRGQADLDVIDGFEGLQDVDLSAVDLREERSRLEAWPFDTLTVWPEASKLPGGFDPVGRLRTARTPGLGVRALHGRGIDGRGVGLAIIDQPLLLSHEEYAHRLVRYDATSLAGVPPQMHAPPLAAIAVGRTIGVAPGAELTFLAVPVWRRDAAMLAAALDEVVRTNRRLPPDQRIRAVAVAQGGLATWEHPETWPRSVAAAEASGVMVVTCDVAPLMVGALRLPPGADPDDPAAYRRGRSSRDDDVLRVPAGGRALASHRGADVFWYDPVGGRSWTAPYLAGLAALAFQVDPDLAPGEVRELLTATARHTDAGPVVDPPAFVAAVRAHRASVSGVTR